MTTYCVALWLCSMWARTLPEGKIHDYLVSGSLALTLCLRLAGSGSGFPPLARWLRSLALVYSLWLSGSGSPALALSPALARVAL